jgi:hypothetical protein
MHRGACKIFLFILLGAISGTHPVCGVDSYKENNFGVNHFLLDGVDDVDLRNSQFKPSFSQATHYADILEELKKKKDAMLRKKFKSGYNKAYFAFATKVNASIRDLQKAIKDLNNSDDIGGPLINAASKLKDISMYNEERANKDRAEQVNEAFNNFKTLYDSEVNNYFNRSNNKIT